MKTQHRTRINSCMACVLLNFYKHTHDIVVIPSVIYSVVIEHTIKRKMITNKECETSQHL